MDVRLANDLGERYRTHCDDQIGAGLADIEHAAHGTPRHEKYFAGLQLPCVGGVAVDRPPEPVGILRADGFRAAADYDHVRLVGHGVVGNRCDTVFLLGFGQVGSFQLMGRPGKSARRPIAVGFGSLRGGVGLMPLCASRKKRRRENDQKHLNTHIPRSLGL
jgi:hypothetical protein